MFIKCLLLFSFFRRGFASAAVLAGGRIFFRMFTDDPGVVSIGLEMMRIISPFYAAYICIEILGGTARGCGDAIPPMLMTCAGICILRVICILTAVPMRPEVSTVAFSYPLTWTATSVFFIIYYLKGSWMKRCRRQKQCGQNGKEDAAKVQA